MTRSEAALKAFEKNGFYFHSKPQYEIPELPRDITELDDEGLMELFVLFTSWSDYLSAQFAVAAIDEREASRFASAMEATAMIANWKGGSGERVAIAKANVELDPKVIAAHDDLETKHAYRKLIETLVQNVDRDSAVVSRELTRRTSDSSFKTRARKYSV